MSVLEKQAHGKGSKKQSVVKYVSIVLTVLFTSILFFKGKDNSKTSLTKKFNEYGSKSLSDRLKDFTYTEESKCPLSEALTPSFENYDLKNIFVNETFIDLAAEKLSGAIKVNTSIGDNTPSPKDDINYWAKFLEFHEYLEEAFPLVHEKLELEKINELGLLYKWEGTNSDLKPIVFMAHQDVVLVNENTLDQWTYPAFSGHYDKETHLIWGRGAIDCKNLLIAELHALEILLEQGFVPTRSVYLSLGFDEESSGVHGAAYLSKHLTDTLGPDSIYSIIDEGPGFTQLSENFYIAAPILNEKGRIDVKISVEGNGGHSSSPPMNGHTNIGILAKAISLMEDTGFEPEYSEKNSIWQFLQCIAEYDDKLDPEFKEAIVKREVSPYYKNKLLSILNSQKEFKDLIKTSQAFDIISGGVKANALPEDAFAIVNHRIDVGSSVKKVLERDLSLAKVIAKTYNYGLILEDKEILPKTDNGIIKVETFGHSIEPAPISPQNEVYDIFQKTIYNTFFNGFLSEKESDDIIFAVSPNTVTVNTDTLYYWNLTSNIYRFQCIKFSVESMKSIHSVNEAVDARDHASTIGFIYDYILNVNEYDS